MIETKRIFVLGNFPHLGLSLLTRPRYFWLKGLVRAGCDVQTFSYRSMMAACSPIPSHRIGRLFKKRVNNMLLCQVQSYRPQVVFLLGVRLKDMDVHVIDMMREAVPDALFVAVEYDWLPELDDIRTTIAARMDIVLSVSGGSFLEKYRNAGAGRCAFMPWPCDPDLQYRYEVGPQWRSDILFTGRFHNPNVPPDPNRQEILTRLSQLSSARLYGCLGRASVAGVDLFRAISGSRVALSINMINDVRLYHSSRIVDCIACGTFTLAKRVPDSDLLFQDKVHVRYFDSPDEFFELAGWYLRHEQERERIARAGMEHAHREFNCQRMARHLLDLVEKGRIDAPWAEILQGDR